MDIRKNKEEKALADVFSLCILDIGANRPMLGFVCVYYHLTIIKPK